MTKWVHLIFNIAFIYYAYTNIKILMGTRDKEDKGEKIMATLVFFLGIVMYVPYLFDIIGWLRDGSKFTDSSLTTLLLCMIFMIMVERIQCRCRKYHG